MMRMKVMTVDRIPVRQGEYSENLENESIAVKQVPTWEHVDNSATNIQYVNDALGGDYVDPIYDIGDNTTSESEDVVDSSSW